MEKLIKIQAAIMQVENLTLDVKYRSIFGYTDDKHLYVKTYCWRHSATLKELFDDMQGICIYFEENSKLLFLEI